MSDVTRKFSKELNSGTAALALLGILINRRSHVRLRTGHAASWDCGRWLADESRSFVSRASIAGTIGLLSSQTEPSTSGPPRRYYSPTPEGKAEFRQWCQVWQQTRNWLDSVLETQNEPQQKTSDPVVPPGAHRYLCELELEVKQDTGMHPEEAISDAREFLLSDYDALVRSAEPPDDQSHYDLIVESFGTPKEGASQYQSATVPTPKCTTPGYAPGWRICCTRCGSPRPLAAIGGTRIGASSVHKYIWGFVMIVSG